MSQTAALYVVASQEAEAASTSCAHHYYLGVRDAFDAVLRGCYDVAVDVDTWQFAEGLLADLDDDARDAVLSDSRRVLATRRRTTVAETVAVI
jgi:hypothetical protein